MAKVFYHSDVSVCPSGAIAVTATEQDRGGRLHDYQIFLTHRDIEFLRKVFKFAEENGLTGEHLGHAAWHVEHGRAAGDCTTCQFNKHPMTDAERLDKAKGALWAIAETTHPTTARDDNTVRYQAYTRAAETMNECFGTKYLPLDKMK